MAGKGRIPKPDNRLSRARDAKRRASLKVIVSDPVPAPELPESMPGGNEWPDETRRWWHMWTVDPLAEEFRATDWSELLDTAVLHGLYWHGDHRVAQELRLRTAKHGATAEDRARLRITFAEADRAEGNHNRPRVIEGDIVDVEEVEEKRKVTPEEWAMMANTIPEERLKLKFEVIENEG